MSVSALESYAANAANFQPAKPLIARLHTAMVNGYAARASIEVDRLNEEIARMATLPGAERILEKLTAQRDKARLTASLAA